MPSLRAWGLLVALAGFGLVACQPNAPTPTPTPDTRDQPEPEPTATLVPTPTATLAPATPTPTPTAPHTPRTPTEAAAPTVPTPVRPQTQNPDGTPSLVLQAHEAYEELSRAIEEVNVSGYRSRTAMEGYLDEYHDVCGLHIPPERVPGEKLASRIDECYAPQGGKPRLSEMYEEYVQAWEEWQADRRVVANATQALMDLCARLRGNHPRC